MRERERANEKETTLPPVFFPPHAWADVGESGSGCAAQLCYEVAGMRLLEPFPLPPGSCVSRKLQSGAGARSQTSTLMWDMRTVTARWNAHSRSFKFFFFFFTKLLLLILCFLFILLNLRHIQLGMCI